MSELKVQDNLTFEDGVLFHDPKGRPCSVPEALAPIADTHGHLGSLRGHDPALALARAAVAGVRLLVVPIDPAGEFPRKWPSPSALFGWLEDTIEVARERLCDLAGVGLVPPTFPGFRTATHPGSSVPDLLDNVHIIAGAHPYNAARLDEEAWARLAELLASPLCVGVGEIGFDFGPYSEISQEDQCQAFRRQLRLAHDFGLPVELHLRDGVDDLLAHEIAARILEEEGVPEAGCDLHCFTSDARVMGEFADMGCHIAFGGAATFSRSAEIRDAVALCPENLILTETDCPYMTPVPLRGEECEPAMVAYTAALLADVREAAGCGERAATYEALWNNACAFFGV